MMESSKVVLINNDVEGGEKDHDSSDIENDFAYRNNVHNAEKHIRMAFVRKVYGLLSIQLLITVAIASVFVLVDPLKEFVQNNSWPFFTSFILTIGVLIALHVKRRDHPVNLILLVLFTVAQAYTIGVVVSLYDAQLVVEALFITLTVVIGLTAFTFQSKWDFSFLGFGLFVGIWLLLLGGIMQIFLQSSAFEWVMSIGGAGLFSVFLIFDTHLTMHILSPEEYILATINIYLDIVNLFLYILRILAAAKK